MKYIILASLLLSGCAGPITGHQYTKKDLVTVYKVTKKGVSMFMTKEQIEKSNLKDIDVAVVGAYKLVSGNDAE